MKHLLTYTVIFLLFASCISKKDDRQAIARVYNSYLYQDDLKELLPTNFSKADSMLLVSNYINSWAKEQLLLQKAEINLSKDQESIENLVKQYRQDVLINKYKEAVIEQYLDTVVTSEDLVKFYDENKEIFRLNEELVKFKYIHFGNDLLNPKEFIALFKSEKKEDIDSLRAREMQLKSFNLNDSIWIRLEDVLLKIPLLDENDKDQILKKSKFLQKEDSLGVYLVAVKDALKKNQTAPMSYSIPTIKQMILHRRKLDLYKKIGETLVEDAINNKEFEIYEMP